MLDITLVRNDPELIKANLKKRAPEKLSVLDAFLEADARWRHAKHRIDALRHERNTLSQSINEAKKRGDDAQAHLEKAKTIPAELKALEEDEQRILAQAESLLAQLPNVIHESVPHGKDASENPVIKTVGDARIPSFPIKNHVELAESLGIADFEASATVSGNGFYFLEGELALLNQALIRFGIEFMNARGYTYVETPLLINRFVLEAAMDVDAFENSIYTTNDGLCMIGTSEHSLLGRYAGRTFDEKDLPRKLYSYSMCFRKEIGSHGINEKGLWRTHQFNKIEQFIFCAPEDSYRYYDELLENSEGILNALGLPYRVIEICTGDLAAWKAKSADVDVWRPTTGEYGEVMSLSNCTDYQARDLNIKLVRRNGTREVVHTLNNTAIATSRILVAILENYQNEDGSVTIPPVLVPYTGFTRIGPRA